MIKQAKASEIRQLAEELFEPIVADLRKQVIAAREETRSYREELMAVTIRLAALERNAQAMRDRLNQRTDSVMEQLARVEDAAEAARRASYVICWDGARHDQTVESK